MYEGQDNWVCFSCRKIMRVPKSFNSDLNDVKCSLCGENCVNFGSKMRFPKKSNIKEWNKLHKVYLEASEEAEKKEHIKHIENRRRIKKEIEKLEKRPESEDRRKLINQLKEGSK
jgi:hypothetical protein